MRRCRDARGGMRQCEIWRALLIKPRARLMMAKVQSYLGRPDESLVSINEWDFTFEIKRVLMVCIS